MNNIFYCINEDCPDGFIKKIPSKLEILGNKIVLFADSIDDINEITKDYKGRIVGLFLTKGNKYTCELVDEMLWHLTITDEMIPFIKETSKCFLELIRIGQEAIDENKGLKIEIERSRKFQETTRTSYNNNTKHIIQKIEDLRIEIERREKAELSLRESESRFRDLVEMLPTIVFETDAEMNLIFANRLAFELFGYEPDELSSGFEVNDMIIPEDRERAKSNLMKRLSGDEIGAIEYKALRKDGTTFDIYLNLSKITRDGKLTGFRGVATDISGRKMAEEALKESESNLSAVIENSFDIILSIDSNYNVITINSIGLKYFSGYFKQPLTPGINILEVLPEPYSSIWKSRYDRALAGERFILEEEFSFAESDYIYEVSFNPIKRDGKIIGVSVFSHNITQRKNAEREIIKASEKLKHLLSLNDATIESTDNGMLVIDFNKNVLKSNTKFFKMWEMPESIAENDYESMKKHVLSRINDKELFLDKVDELYANPEKASLDIIQLLDGKVFERYSKSMMIDGKPYARVWNFRDITERRKTEEELSKLAKLESLGILAGGIAHNFKNMLTAMLMSVELVKMNPERAFHHLEKIRMSIDQATALATKFQTFSKSDEPVLSPADINHILKDSAEVALSGSSAQISYELNETLPVIMADDKQMNEVFTNLLINADQSMPRGGIITLKTDMAYLSDNEVTGLDRGNYIIIDIIDQGIGIPGEYLKEIFTPFFSTKDKGHGLGLASVFYIINKHDGLIKVESEVGKGTSFRIYLPVVHIENSSQINDTDDYSFDKPIHALILDDDINILENMSEIARSFNINLTCTSRPDDTVQTYREFMGSNKFDIVIVDLTLKGFQKDGLDVFNELKEIDPDIKAIVFSGHSTKPIVARYSEYGFAGRLEKPFVLPEFINEIKRVLAK